MEGTGEVAIRAKGTRPRLKRRGYRSKDVLTIYIRDGGICALCGGAVSVSDTSIDHRVPLARGGRHELDNWQLAHLRCNSRKGARTEAEQAEAAKRRAQKARDAVGSTARGGREFQVPAWLFERGGEVSAAAMIMYAVLRWHKGRPVTYDRLRKQFPVPDRTMQRYVSELVRLGLVRIERVGRTNRYVLLDHIWMSQRRDNAQL